MGFFDKKSSKTTNVTDISQTTAISGGEANVSLQDIGGPVNVTTTDFDAVSRAFDAQERSQDAILTATEDILEFGGGAVQSSLDAQLEGQNQSFTFAGGAFTNATGLADRTTQNALTFAGGALENLQKDRLAEQEQVFEFGAGAFDRSVGLIETNVSAVFDTVERTIDSLEQARGDVLQFSAGAIQEVGEQSTEVATSATSTDKLITLGGLALLVAGGLFVYFRGTS